MVTQLSGRFIPAEIVDTVIDLVERSGTDDYPDPAELGRLALVQKAWTGRCQHHLFASVSLTSPERCAELARLLTACPQLGQHVRRLRVAEIVPARNACQSDPALFWAAQSAELRCALAALPNLETLRLGAVGLGTVATLLAAGGTRCAGVTTLELENVTLNGAANLRAYVCAFPALRTLVLDECTTLALAPCDAAREVPGWATELEDASWTHAGVERLRLLSFGAEDAPVQAPVLRAAFPGVRALEIGVSDECDVDLAGALAALYGAQLAELALDAAQWQDPERSELIPERLDLAPCTGLRALRLGPLCLVDGTDADWLVPLLARVRAPALARVELVLEAPVHAGFIDPHEDPADAIDIDALGWVDLDRVLAHHRALEAVAVRVDVSTSGPHPPAVDWRGKIERRLPHARHLLEVTVTHTRVRVREADPEDADMYNA